MTEYKDLPMREGRPYITSPEQIPTNFESEVEEEEFWETAYFADGVLEKSQEIDDEVDIVLGVERLSPLESLIQECMRILAESRPASSDLASHSSSQILTHLALERHAENFSFHYLELGQPTQHQTAIVYLGEFQEFRQVRLFQDEYRVVQVENLIAAQMAKTEKQSGGSSNW